MQCIRLDSCCSLTSSAAALLLCFKGTAPKFDPNTSLPLLQRTKEDLWLQRLRNQLTAPLEEALKNS